MGICIATTSGKGGTGKSTVSAGLAIAYSCMGKSVLLVDLDEGLRCLDLILGIDSDIVYDLSDIFTGTDIADATYTVPRFPSIKVIPAPQGIGSINFAQLKDLAERVTKNYDIVIFDFPAGMDFTLYQSLGKDTQFLTVCNPDPVSVRDAGAVCNNIPSSLKAPRLIINRFNIEYIKSGMYSNIDDIIDISGFRLLGIVPQSDELMMLPVFHKLKKRGQAQKALTRIAKRILGEEIKLPRLKKI
ncbi:MAG: AAA family ATPase [Acutalibacteraceae bacterium]|nr:AAA family ATPase [Clostridia bacterium]MEE0807899.1 AAA family ATPase [Acutalibacteraceae bacterium]